VFELGCCGRPAVNRTDGGSRLRWALNAAQLSSKQHVGVWSTVGHAVAENIAREQAHHILAVLEHVGDAGGGDAQVVFENADSPAHVVTRTMIDWPAMWA